MTSVIELDNVEGEGSVAVPAKILLETLKLMPDMPLVFAIDTENNIVKFSSANGEYGAPCFPSSEYPTVKPISEPKSFDIRASVLQRAISKTIFATGNDELRPNMMGVLGQDRGVLFPHSAQEADCSPQEHPLQLCGDGACRVFWKHSSYSFRFR